MYEDITEDHPAVITLRSLVLGFDRIASSLNTLHNASPVDESPGANELLNNEVRPSGQPWTHQPVEVAHSVIAIRRSVALDHVRAIGHLLGGPAGLYAPHTLVRTLAEVGGSSPGSAIRTYR